jgi:hypothetical protein
MESIKEPVRPYYKSALTVVHKKKEEKDQHQHEKKDKTAKDPYKEWNMPEQPKGYIKSRKNDSL